MRIRCEGNGRLTDRATVMPVNTSQAISIYCRLPGNNVSVCKRDVMNSAKFQNWALSRLLKIRLIFLEQFRK